VPDWGATLSQFPTDEVLVVNDVGPLLEKTTKFWDVAAPLIELKVSWEGLTVSEDGWAPKVVASSVARMGNPSSLV